MDQTLPNLLIMTIRLAGWIKKPNITQHTASLSPSDLDDPSLSDDGSIHSNNNNKHRGQGRPNEPASNPLLDNRASNSTLQQN